jgi:acyl-CoA thioesterase FadM
VDVRIRIVKMSRRAITYACTLSVGHAVAAEGSMTIVCVRMGAEPLEAVSIPEAIASRFEAVAC